MKKIIYILTLALFATTSCVTTLNDGLKTTSVPPEPGTLVKVQFTAEFPDLAPTTRAAMGELPVIEKMYVAVFGEGMYLQNWIPATKTNVTGTGSSTKATYSIYLPLVDEARTLDFVANPPSENNPPEFDYEKNILPNMITSGNDGAYWQRVSLPNGIKAAKNATGDYILDGDGNYTVDLNSVAPLQLVYLIRNYAKIVVQAAETAMFSLLNWTLINYPDRGSLAPFDISTGEVSEAYMNIKAYEGRPKGDFYETLTTTYIGYEPADMEIVNTWPQNPVYVSSGVPQYMYERQMPEQDQTSIVAEIKWKTQTEYANAGGEGTIPAGLAGQTYWYKIELLDKEGEYMPILRHIQYNLSIDGLNEAGYGTAKAAFDGNYFGNISSSLETSSLNEISTGESRIYVDYTDQTFLGGDEGLTLNYWFAPDDANNPNNHITRTTGNVTISVTTKNVAGYTNPIENFSVNYDTGVITFDTKTRTTELQKGIIRVQGKVGDKRALFREVTINVIGDLAFTSETQITSAPTSDSSDQPVVITIGLPDDIPASLFPIQIRIEAEQNSLSTTNPKIPVQNGPSQFASKSGQRSFYYIYTIEYSQYPHPDPITHEIVGTTTFPLTFYTTKNGGNSTDILISDMNGYFDPPVKLTLTI